MKRIRFILFGLLFALSMGAENALPPAGSAAAVTDIAAPEAAALKDGNVLLDSLLTLFENLAAPEKKGAAGEQNVPLSGLALVDSRLSQLAKDAKLALEAGVIDKIFYNRYERMLTIFKLVTMPILRNEMLKNLFMRAFEEFVWNVTYERWVWEDKDSIAKMAAAMEEEFVQMKFYLDTRQAREEFKKKIGNRILPPPPPPASAKKKPESK
jgi:hypothetical protein